jgi:glyoxylase-like metal-dependent hydrolase (beta-lactamase superfamily II)
LVDAGFLKDIPQGKYFEIVNYVRPDSALAKIALNPEDITDIILSHPHWDHIDGIGLFPKAHIWVQKDDYGYFVGAARQKGNNGDNGGFSQRDVRMLVDLDLAGRVTLVDGDNYIPDHMTPPSRGGTLDPAGYVKAMQRMTTMVSDKKYIIPGHDAQVFSRFPTIANGVVQIK